jgi:hypothetical protein
MKQSDPDFFELLRSAHRSAVHLEMRDSYGLADEVEDFTAWRRGHRVNWADLSVWWNSFHAAVADAVGRGVVMRRARIVSEPVSEYIRYEHYLTTANVTAGEEVRWLPRKLATAIPLPGNDFWLFDETALIVNHFDGQGDWASPGMELDDDPDAVKLCASAFELVWERAVPHADFTV